MSKSFSELTEDREEYLDHVLKEYGPGIAEVARRFIDGEIEPRPIPVADSWAFD